MTKERGRAKSPEQEGSGGGKTVARARKKEAPGDSAKLKHSAPAAVTTSRARHKPSSTGAPSASRSSSKAAAKNAEVPAKSKGRKAAPAASLKEPVASKAKRRLAQSPEPLAQDASATSLASQPQEGSRPRDERPADWTDQLVERWVKRGHMLLQKLAEHGAADHEYRADLKEGRFVWIAPDGHVSVEAHANMLCSWSRSTLVLSMAWADPLVHHAAEQVDDMPSEHDDVNEEKAWHLAMEAAELAGAEYLYRVPTPHAWYFLALRNLTFDPKRAAFRPGTPVGLVLRELAQMREAIESRAEPSEVIRERLSSFGSALLHQAEYAYRNTDWVARLERTGKCLTQLASRLPRQSYASVAAGHLSDEWIERDLAVDLIQAISLLEDEWSMFA